MFVRSTSRWVTARTRARPDGAHEHALALERGAQRGRVAVPEDDDVRLDLASGRARCRGSRPDPRRARARSRGPRPAGRRCGRARTARRRRRSPPGAASRRTSACSATPRRSGRASRRGTAPTRCAEPLREVEPGGVEPARVSRRGHAGGHDGVHQPRAVQMQRAARPRARRRSPPRICASGHTRPPAMFVVCSTETSRDRGR